MTVKILGIAGSPRHGNTDVMVKTALEAAAGTGNVEIDFFSTADFEINGCASCYKCTKTSMEHFCLGREVRKDDANQLFKRMLSVCSRPNLGMRVAEMTKVIKAGYETAETVWPYKGI